MMLLPLKIFTLFTIINIVASDIIQTARQQKWNVLGYDETEAYLKKPGIKTKTKDRESSRRTKLLECYDVYQALKMKNLIEANYRLNLPLYNTHTSKTFYSDITLKKGANQTKAPTIKHDVTQCYGRIDPTITFDEHNDQFFNQYYYARIDTSTILVFKRFREYSPREDLLLPFRTITGVVAINEKEVTMNEKEVYWPDDIHKDEHLMEFPQPMYTIVNNPQYVELSIIREILHGPYGLLQKDGLSHINGYWKNQTCIACEEYIKQKVKKDYVYNRNQQFDDAVTVYPIIFNLENHRYFNKNKEMHKKNMILCHDMERGSETNIGISCGPHLRSLVIYEKVVLDGENDALVVGYHPKIIIENVVWLAGTCQYDDIFSQSNFKLHHIYENKPIITYHKQSSSLSQPARTSSRLDKKPSASTSTSKHTVKRTEFIGSSTYGDVSRRKSTKNDDDYEEGEIMDETSVTHPPEISSTINEGDTRSESANLPVIAIKDSDNDPKQPDKSSPEQSKNKGKQVAVDIPNLTTSNESRYTEIHQPTVGSSGLQVGSVSREADLMRTEVDKPTSTQHSDENAMQLDKPSPVNKGSEEETVKSSNIISGAEDTHVREMILKDINDDNTMLLDNQSFSVNKNIKEKTDISSENASTDSTKVMQDTTDDTVKQLAEFTPTAENTSELNEKEKEIIVDDVYQQDQPEDDHTKVKSMEVTTASSSKMPTIDLNMTLDDEDKNTDQSDSETAEKKAVFGFDLNASLDDQGNIIEEPPKKKLKTSNPIANIDLNENLETTETQTSGTAMDYNLERNV